jgi:hypothetical protein
MGRGLFDSTDPTVNSKIAYSGVTMILIIAFVICHLAGVPVDIQVLLALIGLVTSLMVFYAVDKKKGKDIEK